MLNHEKKFIHARYVRLSLSLSLATQVNDCCCGCGPSLLNCACACPPCFGYFKHLFGVRYVSVIVQCGYSYLERYTLLCHLCGKRAKQCATVLSLIA